MGAKCNLAFTIIIVNRRLADLKYGDKARAWI